MPSCSGKSILIKERDELNIKFRKMHWLLGHNSELSIQNQIILYKQVILPVIVMVSSSGAAPVILIFK
jgi:hypothetical protein